MYVYIYIYVYVLVHQLCKQPFSPIAPTFWFLKIVASLRNKDIVSSDKVKLHFGVFSRSTL